MGEGKKLSCEWYQKPSDTKIILSFPSCAPIQHKRTLIEGTILRLIRSTSSWQDFNEYQYKLLHYRKVMLFSNDSSCMIKTAQLTLALLKLIE